MIKACFRYSMFLPIIVIAFSMSLMAQDKYPVEVFGGYSYLNSDFSDFSDESDELINSRQSAHGFNGSVTANFHKYVGAKFDYSFHSGNVKVDETFLSGDSGIDMRTHQFLFGLQVKNNKKDGPRFKPFFHVLAGVARQSVDFSDFEFTKVESKLAPSGTVCGADCRLTFTDFAMAIGGGLDIKVSKHIDIRLGQFDYNPIFRGDRTDDDFFGAIPGGTQNNFRFSTGIVIH